MNAIIDERNEEALYSYVIASGEMRYIEINSREIYLRDDSSRGLLVQGDIPGCGEGCRADLSQILLEYAITCEGCKQAESARESALVFGDQLGRVLSKRLSEVLPVHSSSELFTGAYNCILNSMHAPYFLEVSENQLRYRLDRCPLHEAAAKTGLARGIPAALQAFIALSSSMVEALAPGWKLTHPQASDFTESLVEIRFIG